MKYAICNETFGDQPLSETLRVARELGYTGIEIAPFTLLPGAEVVDVREISDARRSEVRLQASDTGMEVVGLHWLLAKTEGLYLTSPEASVQTQTAEYFKELAQLCADLGGKVLVLGSGRYRNLLPGVSYEQAEEIAAEVIRRAMPTVSDLGLILALEPLGAAEGSFLPDAEKGIQLAKLIDSPNCRLHLDVRAMSSEQKPIPDIIRDSRDWLVHFHANDPNLLGPGMGDVEFEPIFAALRDIEYHGWVSVEVFDYEPGPTEIARASIDYMQRVAAELFA